MPQEEERVPGTTPALLLGPAEAEPGFPADDELLAAEPRGLLGAEGPVAGVAGVGFGRDMAKVRVDVQAARSARLVPERTLSVDDPFAKM
jgi:hypothetical protein